ncbi:MAG: hypothetical protein ACM3ML_15685 [Micromonosporaceae bacterium]
MADNITAGRGKPRAMAARGRRSGQLNRRRGGHGGGTLAVTRSGVGAVHQEQPSQDRTQNGGAGDQPRRWTIRLRTSPMFARWLKNSTESTGRRPAAIPPRSSGI